jgi:hypothetical protein
LIRASDESVDFVVMGRRRREPADATTYYRD